MSTVKYGMVARNRRRRSRSDDVGVWIIADSWPAPRLEPAIELRFVGWLTSDCSRSAGAPSKEITRCLEWSQSTRKETSAPSKVTGSRRAGHGAGGARRPPGARSDVEGWEGLCRHWRESPRQKWK